jgi:hypothetical protein
MAEVFAEHNTLVTDRGRAFAARVCGAPMDDSLWQGWIEFTAVGDGEIVRTPRETTQPNRAGLEYWATGLTATYFEGALTRALNPRTGQVKPGPGPAFEEPARERVRAADAPLAAKPVESALDPFAAYQKGERVFRQQLHALAPWHLVNIVRAYELSQADPATLASTPAEVLIDLILNAVRAESATRPRP